MAALLRMDAALIPAGNCLKTAAGCSVTAGVRTVTDVAILRNTACDTVYDIAEDFADYSILGG